MDKKTYRGPLTLKADEAQPGEFAAVFATLNVVDLDGDVTLPGAFGKQHVLIEPWNHNYQELPIGRGKIHEAGDQAIVEGKLFLDLPAGQQHHLVLKEMGADQEWSYTFNILEAERGQREGKDVRFLKKLDVIGVSPVMRGAGVDTRTMDIKGKPAAEGQTGDGVLSSPAIRIRAQLDIIELED